MLFLKKKNVFMTLLFTCVKTEQACSTQKAFQSPPMIECICFDLYSFGDCITSKNPFILKGCKRTVMMAAVLSNDDDRRASTATTSDSLKEAADAGTAACDGSVFCCLCMGSLKYNSA